MTAAVRMLAYGCPVDLLDEYVQIGESTTIESLKHFCDAIIGIFEHQYLRKPNEDDISRLLQEGEDQGFPANLLIDIHSSHGRGHCGKTSSPSLNLTLLQIALAALSPCSYYFKMEDGDIIDVLEWVRYTVAPQSTFITLPRLKGEIPILIEVQAEEGVARADHYNRFYMMGRNTPLRNLLLYYCDRVSAFYECMRFRLRDSYVNPDKTADDLDLVDGDIIFSMHVLRGG
ncbi:hypothetical protein PTKIN_Ptkin16aG0031000 [Pterospermum kingtungense]